MGKVGLVLHRACGAQVIWWKLHVKVSALGEVRQSQVGLVALALVAALIRWRSTRKLERSRLNGLVKLFQIDSILECDSPTPYYYCTTDM
jgi:hypothetical protein